MKNGFSHHQRILQKGATISRFMDSTEVSNQTITHDGMKSIMSHHNVTQNIFKQVDTDDRIKKMCNSRQRLYKDYKVPRRNKETQYKEFDQLDKREEQDDKVAKAGKPTEKDKNQC